MTIHGSYAALAGLFAYPAGKDELVTACGDVSGFLERAGIPCPIGPFAEFAAASSLAELQEEYVATFDFNPATALYLGHHLFGDNRKRGGYMIALKQEYGRHGFTPPANELPDHLPVVLGFLAHLACGESTGARREFIVGSVVPGIERLCAAFAARRNSPWKPLVDAARLLCTLDCAAGVAPGKEVAPC